MYKWNSRWLDEWVNSWESGCMNEWTGTWSYINPFPGIHYPKTFEDFWYYLFSAPFSIVWGHVLEGPPPFVSSCCDRQSNNIMGMERLSIVTDITADHARQLELYKIDLCGGLSTKDRGHDIIEYDGHVKEGINATSDPWKTAPSILKSSGIQLLPLYPTHCL